MEWENVVTATYYVADVHVTVVFVVIVFQVYFQPCYKVERYHPVLERP